GTCFLDEIGELTAPLQAKLLRTLQERSIRRVGGNDEIPFDVRVVVATNRDLRKLVADGGFRDDLYYRLNVVTITMPPLRERASDIPLLAQHFLEVFARRSGRAIKRLAPESVALLTGYRWPGNVRELEHVIERATALSASETLLPDDFPPHLRGERDRAPRPRARRLRPRGPHAGPRRADPRHPRVHGPAQVRARGRYQPGGVRGRGRNPFRVAAHVDRDRPAFPRAFSASAAVCAPAGPDHDGARDDRLRERRPRPGHHRDRVRRGHTRSLEDGHDARGRNSARLLSVGSALHGGAGCRQPDRSTRGRVAGGGTAANGERHGELRIERRRRVRCGDRRPGRPRRGLPSGE